jgi:hypothetical protein
MICISYKKCDPLIILGYQIHSSFYFFINNNFMKKKKENEINIEKSERKNYFIENVRIIKSINHEVC